MRNEQLTDNIMPWWWWNKVLEWVAGKECAGPPCLYKCMNLWEECHQQKTLFLLVAFWKKESGNSQTTFMAFFFSLPANRHTHIGNRPRSIAFAILFFAERHMLLTRAEGLPLNGAVSAGIIFAVWIQEDVLVDPPTQAEHVGGRVVTALQDLEHDLQSLLTIACGVPPEGVTG